MAVPGALYVAYALTYFAYPLVDRGWTIDHLVHNAWQFAQGDPVYADPRLGSPTAFMYTPGLPLMLVPLVAAFGPELWTARLLNLVAAALLVAIVTRETARRVRDRRLVWFAPGLVVLVGAAHAHALLVAHPETWALAWSFLALLAARRAAETGRGLAWPVLLSCAAVATKQTALVHALAAAAPLAACRRPARAALQLACVAGLLAALAAWAQHATDGRFLEYVLLAGRQQLVWSRLPGIVLYLAYYLGPFVLVLAAARALAPGPAPAPTAPTPAPRRLRLVGRLRDPFLVALVLSVPAALLVMAKESSAANNLLAPCLLLVPFVLQAIDALLPRLAERPARAATAAALCLAWTGWRVAEDAPPLWHRIAAHDEGLAAARRLDATVRAARGPVWIPTEIALALHHGLPVVSPAAILFEFRHDPEVRRPILARIEAAEFSTVLLPDGLFSLLPEPEFAPVLRARYRPVEVIGSSPSIGTFGSVTVLERRD
jgi:hypothetical protein